MDNQLNTVAIINIFVPGDNCFLRLPAGGDDWSNMANGAWKERRLAKLRIIVVVLINDNACLFRWEK